MTRPPTDIERAVLFILGGLLAEWWCRTVIVREFRRELRVL